MPKISVLIPVYNVEKYLERCLDSIEKQSFNDFEVILVDDGSTDCSGQICDSYSKKDCRFKVFHRKNYGISATRNFCIEKASGEYIQFVDSDDWVELDMLEQMYSKALTCNADIVGCNFCEEYGYKTNVVDVSFESKDSFLRDVVGDRWGVVWKLLIRRKLMIENSIDFPSNINGGEDYVFVVKSLVNADNVVSLDRCFYHYNRTNLSSTISTPNYKKILEQIEATRIVEKFLKDKSYNIYVEKSLLRRKFYCKLPLLKMNYLEWKRIFPECNGLMGKYGGIKNCIRYFFAKLGLFKLFQK